MANEDIKWWLLPLDELETQYRASCKKYHPDSDSGKSDIDKFQKIQDIYETIIAYRKAKLSLDVSVTLSELYHGCIKEVIILDPQGHPERLAIMIAVGSYNGQIITITTEKFKTVHVTLRENNDTRFTRDGYNLLINLDITLTQAIVGDPVLVGHFDRIIRVPTRIPHTNYRQIIPGMGMPINDSGHYGDLYICYQVIFPSEITEDFEQELFAVKY